MAQTQPGVIIVHGIGTQAPGETLASYVGALLPAFEQGVILDSQNKQINVTDISDSGITRVRIKSGTQLVYFYEAYWADILDSEHVTGGFNIAMWEEVAWFPKINDKLNIWPRNRYSRWHILRRKVEFKVLLYAMVFIDAMLPRFQRINKVLDEIVSDVWHYVYGCGGAEPSSLALENVMPEIVQQVRNCASLAESDKCTELHMVAHSLGSVVAYHALTAYWDLGKPVDDPIPIKNFYTIGSPLEKFLFIWPMLINPAPHDMRLQVDGKTLATAESLQWTNYWSRFDQISGRIRNYSVPNWPNRQERRVTNCHILGLGDLARAHISYNMHPKFLNHFLKELQVDTKELRTFTARRLMDRVLGVVIDLLVPTLVLSSLLLGYGLIVAWAAMLGAIIGYYTYEFSAMIDPVITQYDPLQMMRDLENTLLAEIWNGDLATGWALIYAFMSVLSATAMLVVLVSRESILRASRSHQVLSHQPNDIADSWTQYLIHFVEPSFLLRPVLKPWLGSSTVSRRFKITLVIASNFVQMIILSLCLVGAIWVYARL